MWLSGPVRRVPEFGRPQALRLGFHLTPGMRVGLYGGSFNPVHEGHLEVAHTALMRLGLDRLIWLVSPGNPLKVGGAGRSGRALRAADLNARLAGVRRAVRGRSMIVSGLEARTGSVFSVDTLRVLKARYPGVRFVWVMGADNLADFHRWRGWPAILRQVPVVVVARPGSTLAGLAAPAARRFARWRRPLTGASRLASLSPPAWIYLPMPLMAISSTAIRSRSRPT